MPFVRRAGIARAPESVLGDRGRGVPLVELGVDDLLDDPVVDQVPLLIARV